jgi:hypothetical protein
LLILDEIEGAGAVQCEQIWQLGTGAEHVSFASSSPIGPRDSWYSPGYGSRLPGRALVVAESAESRVRIVTALTAGTERVVPSFAEAATEIERTLADSSGDSSR